MWKKLDAWAQAIYEWARSSGMQDSVMTIDELSSGDEVRGTGGSLGVTHETPSCGCPFYSFGCPSDHWLRLCAGHPARDS
jgi:hypothetical protein